MMGPGHLGIAFAAKAVSPKAPLWGLLIASETLDLLCFGLIAVGVEKAGVSQTDIIQGIRIVTRSSIPWSHGLFMSILWSILAAGITYPIFHDLHTSVVFGLVVFSHWVLDFIVHLPDLPLFFDQSPKVGLGLWGTGNGLILSGILEFFLLAGGITIYLTSQKRLANGYKLDKS